MEVQQYFDLGACGLIASVTSDRFIKVPSIDIRLSGDVQLNPKHRSVDKLHRPLRTATQLSLPLITMAAAVKDDVAVFGADHQASFSYWHFLFALKLLLVTEELDRHVLSAITSTAGVFHEQTKECFGIDNSACRVAYERVRSDWLLLARDGYFQPNRIRINYGAADRRRIKERGHLEPTLLRHRFEYKLLAETLFMDQVAHFPIAEAVIAPSDAHRPDLIFCDPETQPIELVRKRFQCNPGVLSKPKRASNSRYRSIISLARYVAKASTSIFSSCPDTLLAFSPRRFESRAARTSPTITSIRGL